MATDLEKAKELVQQDMAERAKLAGEKIQEICKEYNVFITFDQNGQPMINANM